MKIFDKSQNFLKFLKFLNFSKFLNMRVLSFKVTTYNSNVSFRAHQNLFANICSWTVPPISDESSMNLQQPYPPPPVDSSTDISSSPWAWGPCIRTGFPSDFRYL